MKLDISSSANSAEKNKEWMKKHPILTGFIVLCFIFIIGSMFGGSDKTPTNTLTPQVATETVKKAVDPVAKTNLMLL